MRWSWEAEHNGVAYLMLGQMYQHGQCVEKNFQKAKECYEKPGKDYVLGLTYLGKLEREMGHPLKAGYRLKAGLVAYKIARKILMTRDSEAPDGNRLRV